MSGIAFAAALLATWRVTHLVVDEDGPFDLLLRVRRFAGTIRLDRLVACFLCASVWIAIPFAIALTRQVIDVIVLVFALSGGAILLERMTSRGAEPRFFEEPEETRERR